MKLPTIAQINKEQVHTREVYEDCLQKNIDSGTPMPDYLKELFEEYLEYGESVKNEIMAGNKLRAWCKNLYLLGIARSLFDEIYIWSVGKSIGPEFLDSIDPTKE